MNPEIEEIFLEALDLLGQEREDFLEAACRDHPGIRAEVDRLLTYALKAEEFFGEASTVLGHLAHRRSFGVEKLGDRIGPYTLVERLGEGGFGVVWRGSQTHPLRREVAIKVIKAGMDTREVLARFEGEREALSRMDHPNVARVLDAGETDSGRPYVVMELVRGEPVTTFCDESALPLRERLRLFVEICRALSHAHQKGVIHRDIKPTNVLVTREEHAVKVIDFGIAKAVKGRLADRTLMTMGAQLMGTPTYMSPEQAGDGHDLDTRTDVYALGTLLYELMVGVTPLDHKALTARGQEEMRRMILETEPKRPSLRFAALDEEKQRKIAAARNTTPSELRHLIGPDLDWITIKALEKEPGRRYSTADALAEDIVRFLGDQPVSARRPSTGYLISKFFRRNRTAVLLTLGVAAVLVVATAVSIGEAVKATRAEGRATALLRDSKAVSSLLTDLFRLPHPEANGRNITLLEALKTASLKLNETEGLQPERKALLQAALARSYEGLGLYPEAIDLLKKALKSDEAVLGSLHPSTLEVQGQLGKILFDCGYYAEARESLRSEVDRRMRAEGENNPGTQRARKLLEESSLRSGKEPWPDSTPEHEEHRTQPGNTQDVTGQREAMRKLLDGKERSLSELRQSHRPDDPEVLKATADLATSYANCVYRDDAVRVQGELVDLIRAKYGETHHLTLREEETLAYYLWRAGQRKPSLEHRKNNIAKQRQVYGPEHPTTLESLGWMIMELYRAGDTKGAITLSGEVVPALERVAGPRDRNTLDAKSWLARALISDGQTQKALEILEQVAPLMSDDTYVNLALANLEIWFGKKDNYERTRARMLDFCIQEIEQNGLINRPDILERALLICSLTPVNDGTQKAALLKTLERCREIRKAPDAPKIKEAGEQWRQFVAGMVYFRIGQYQHAIQSFGEAQKPDALNKKAAPEALLSALFQESCRRQLGTKPDDATALLGNAHEKFGTPFSEQEPLFGRCTTDTFPMTSWNLLREVERDLSVQ